MVKVPDKLASDDFQPPKLTIIEGGKKDDEIQLLDPKAKGGTELQVRKVFSSLDKDLIDKFQWIISYPKEKLDPDKKKLLWMHETPFDGGVKQLFESQEYINQFERIIFVSHWQQQLFNLIYKLPYEKSVVIQNAIDPIFPKDKPKGKFKLIYASTPHRGLDVLLTALQYLNHRNDFELDVYSSFKLYNRGSQDLQFQPLFDKCHELPYVNYKGIVENEELKNIMSDAHILTYPSTYMETSCITAMEAMSAEMMVMCPNYGALPETTANFAWMYNYVQNKEDHARIFAHLLNGVLDNYWNDTIQKLLQMQKVYADTFYNWNLRLGQWKSFLNSLVD